MHVLSWLVPSTSASISPWGHNRVLGKQAVPGVVPDLKSPSAQGAHVNRGVTCWPGGQATVVVVVVVMVVVVVAVVVVVVVVVVVL